MSRWLGMFEMRDVLDDVHAEMQEWHDRTCFGSTAHWQNCHSPHCIRMTEILGQTNHL